LGHDKPFLAQEDSSSVIMPSASTVSVLALALAVACAPLPRARSAVDPSWSRVPIRSAAFAAAGRLGGEGAQVVRALGASRANADFMLLGADVGGVHRSLTGGAAWSPAMVGWHSRGATAFAFDDADALHVLGVGGNSGSFGGANGVHVSFDGAASWSFVLPIADADGCLDGSAVAFDPSTAGAVAYFSSAAGLWRSTNAGSNWTLVNRFLSNACLALDSRGSLYASSNDYESFGFYSCGRGYDGAGGANCTRVRSEYTTGVDVARDGSDLVFISNWAGVMTSADGGQSFKLLPGAGLPAPGTTPMRHVSVSPADASRISVWFAVGPYYNTTFAISHDGGATFSCSVFDNSDAFLPFNGRDGKPVWHATNASIFFNAGGDWPTRSDDGGLTLRWSGAGYNVVMTGGAFAFSTFATNAVFLAFQDYAGAVTLDGGSSWTSVVGPHGISGQAWGGMDYGGFALNGSTLWAGDSPSWTGPRTLKVSFDSGATWATASVGGAPAVFAGLDASFGDPLRELVGFASDLRTADGGRSWARMAGCAGVLAADAAGALYGVAPAGAGVVRSSDGGESWQALFATPGGAAVHDVAPGAAGSLFVVAGGALFACTPAGGWLCASLQARLPADQAGGAAVTSVAVDAADTRIVYVSAKRDVFLADNAVMRSVDGGATFERLVLDAPLAGDALQGPHEVSWLRVQPHTRALWAAGECFGVWTAPAPVLE
jgi:hypothetical protein